MDNINIITSTYIKPFRYISPDYDETLALKRELHDLHFSRDPFYLTLSELVEILKWKLRIQFGRRKDAGQVNTEEIIQSVTKLALNIKNLDIDYELELQVGILISIRGIGVPEASAILALINPTKYTVIDFRVWRQIFHTNLNSFLISDYKKYMRELRKPGAELGWPVQEVDLAIWAYDIKHNVKFIN